MRGTTTATKSSLLPSKFICTNQNRNDNKNISNNTKRNNSSKINHSNGNHRIEEVRIESNDDSPNDSNVSAKVLGTFDYVIVGGGPSAMGFLMGLFSLSSLDQTLSTNPYGFRNNDDGNENQRDNQNRETNKPTENVGCTKTSRRHRQETTTSISKAVEGDVGKSFDDCGTPCLSPVNTRITVALIERGTLSPSSSSKPLSNRYLSQWFSASHVTDDRLNQNHTGHIGHSGNISVNGSSCIDSGAGNTNSMEKNGECNHQQHNQNNQQNAQAPQQRCWWPLPLKDHEIVRILDVPVGKGLGGTSNINGGIIMPPSRADFEDNEDWPKSIADHMMNSVHAVVTAMNRNGAVFYNNTTNNLSSNSLSLLWHELRIPSLCTKVPCAAGYEDYANHHKSSRKLHLQQSPVRKNYYEALLEPILRNTCKSSWTNNDTHCNHNISLQIFTGYSCQRLLLTTNHQSTPTALAAPNSPPSISTAATGAGQCTGVEVYDHITGTYQIVHANRDVIVAAGAIETPALLLASGIGPLQPHQSPQPPQPSTNLSAPFVAAYKSLKKLDDNQICCSRHSPNNKKVTAPNKLDDNAVNTAFVRVPSVGYHLKDHLVLGRALLSFPRRSKTRNTLNGVQSIQTIRLSNYNTPKYDDSYDVINTHKVYKTRTRRASKSVKVKQIKNQLHKSKGLSSVTKDNNGLCDHGTVAQIVTLDSSVFLDTLPTLLSSCLRYQFLPSMVPTSTLATSSLTRQSATLSLVIIQTINLLLALVHKTVRFLLYLLIAYTPLYFILHYCVTVELICIMSPKSEGRITLTSKSGLCSKCLHRRSGYNLNIHLGYLSDSRDIQQLRMAWLEHTKNKISTIQYTVEIFPSFLVRPWFHRSRLPPKNNHCPNSCNNNSRVSHYGKYGTSTTLRQLQRQLPLHDTILHDERFAWYAKAFVLPYFHWSGTCRMKKSKHKIKQQQQQIYHDSTTINQSEIQRYRLENRFISCSSSLNGCQQRIHARVSQNNILCHELSADYNNNNRHEGIVQNDNAYDDTVPDDDDWVVDEKFRVRGITNLRICDASVFPTSTSAPTCVTCAALGYTFATQILFQSSHTSSVS